MSGRRLLVIMYNDSQWLNNKASFCMILQLCIVSYLIEDVIWSIKYNYYSIKTNLFVLG